MGKDISAMVTKMRRIIVQQSEDVKKLIKIIEQKELSDEEKKIITQYKKEYFTYHDRQKDTQGDGF